MAKIKFGMIVTDGRGKLGGQVFSKNRSGSYIRTKVTPVNPQTAAQMAVRSSFGVFSQGWSGLTEALRTGWNDAVKDWSKTDIFGDLRNPTGKNLYLRLNQQATQAGYASFNTVPAKLEMVEGIIGAVQINITANTLVIVGYYLGADARLLISGTPTLSNGTSFVKNKLRNIINVLGSSYDSTDTFDAYVSHFGTPTAGDNIYISVKYVLPNGQASPIQVIKAIVNA